MLTSGDQVGFISTLTLRPHAPTGIRGLSRVPLYDWLAVDIGLVVDDGRS
jgi:hypothetical protein